MNARSTSCPSPHFALTRADSGAPSAARVPRLVLDTNVLLDCWVFDDPRARPLWLAIVSASTDLICLRSADTDAELADVLQRAAFADRLQARGHQPVALIARWQSTATFVDRVFPAGWHCTDPQDQKFLDLAATRRADLLVSKDKAVLKSARRARQHGVNIVTPRQALAVLGIAADSV